MAWSSLVTHPDVSLAATVHDRTLLSHYLGDIETNVSDLHTSWVVV
jgi:hypothetical protein